MVFSMSKENRHKKTPLIGVFKMSRWYSIAYRIKTRIWGIFSRFLPFPLSPALCAILKIGFSVLSFRKGKGKPSKKPNMKKTLCCQSWVETFNASQLRFVPRGILRFVLFRFPRENRSFQCVVVYARPIAPKNQIELPYVQNVLCLASRPAPVNGSLENQFLSAPKTPHLDNYFREVAKVFVDGIQQLTDCENVNLFLSSEHREFRKFEVVIG